ncbi:methyltransferase, FkbM family [Clostridiales bacterium oral taxon 876 str. F0540]|nr:methyltransferase, FkbM family [Clostridiales bacterium oral taxon 876 str. F0540]
MCFKIINKKNDILHSYQSLINMFYEKSSVRYILGINEWADELIDYLKENKLSIEGIIDDYSDREFYKGLPVVKINDITNKNVVVISCVIDGKLTTAIQNLKNRGFYKVISYLHLCLIEEKLNKIHYCHDNQYDIENYKYKYNWLYEILNDDYSKDTLEYITDFRYNFNIDVMNNFKFNLDKQYFDDLIILKDNETFVDCGGFDGKTTEQFVKLCTNYKKIYYFEPSKLYFEKSLDNLKDYQNIIFFNEGTFKENAQLKFLTKGSESAISENGEDVISVVKLDDVIEDEVTYIKMDVEGVEYDSLIGAEKIIRKYKPKLAICVYHNQKDFWRIPELVLSYNKNYRVYLRHYTEGILETVMYFL